jgi:hypothetical protein
LAAGRDKKLENDPSASDAATAGIDEAGNKALAGDTAAIAYMTSKANNKNDNYTAADQATSGYTGTSSTTSSISDEDKTLKVIGTIIKKNTTGLASGGYTGEFEGGKLAILHQKELVLNEDDTSNILSAVNAIRDLEPALLTAIASALDNNASAGMGLMAAKLGTVSASGSSGSLEQQVHIEATFPSVTSANEVEEALKSLVNDAVQYVNINN